MQKFVDKVCDSTIQLNSKNYYLSSFGVVLKENTHNYLRILCEAL